jgi:hypothetical protein
MPIRCRVTFWHPVGARIGNVLSFDHPEGSDGLPRDGAADMPTEWRLR